MKVDKKATNAARKKHAAGVARLNKFFNVTEVLVRSMVPQDQKWLSRSKKARLIYREARTQADPTWPVRRARRKSQRRARRVNR